MRQTGLIPSGSQQNSTLPLQATDKYLFYASCVAIYVLNAQTFVVEKILNATNSHISCFTINPHNTNSLVTVGTCGQILMWNIEEVRILLIRLFLGAVLFNAFVFALHLFGIISLIFYIHRKTSPQV